MCHEFAEVWLYTIYEIGRGSTEHGLRFVWDNCKISIEKRKFTFQDKIERPSNDIDQHHRKVDWIGSVVVISQNE